VFFSPSNASANCFSFRDSQGYGSGSGNGVIGAGTNVQGVFDSGLIDPGGVFGLTIQGHWEGAEGGALLDITSDSTIYITPSAEMFATESGAHGVRIANNSSEATISPSAMRGISGDAIRIEAANRVIITPQIEFTDINGDSINTVETLGGPSVIPRQYAIKGSVTYPSAAWGNMVWPDGWQLYASGSTTVSAGDTGTILTQYGGKANESYRGPQSAGWSLTDPGADLEFEFRQTWNTSTNQIQYMVDEVNGGSGSADISWEIHRLRSA